MHCLEKALEGEGTEEGVEEEKKYNNEDGGKYSLLIPCSELRHVDYDVFGSKFAQIKTITTFVRHEMRIDI